MMRTYELMVVAKSDFPADDDAKRQALIDSLVGEGATVANVTVIGKKRLAYEIKKQNEGIYMLATVTARGLRGAEIQKRVTMNGDVLRHLLVVKN